MTNISAVDIWIYADGNLIGSLDMSGDGVLNDDPDNKDLSRDGMPTSYEKQYGVVNGGWQHPYLYNARYAVLLASGAWEAGKNYPAYWNDIKYLYDVLADGYNYQEENVHLLYSVWGDVDHSDGCEAVDDEASRDGLECAIKSVEQNMTVNDFLIMGLRGHGPILELDNECEIIPGISIILDEIFEYLLYEEVNTYLKNTTYARMAISIGACHSGTAIPHLKGENRIVMTSSKADEPSYSTVSSDNQYSAFFYEGRLYYTPSNYHPYDGLVKRLGSIEEPTFLWQAWFAGYIACLNNYSHFLGKIKSDGTSTPQITNEYLALYTYL